MIYLINSEVLNDYQIVQNQQAKRTKLFSLNTPNARFVDFNYNTLWSNIMQKAEISAFATNMFSYFQRTDEYTGSRTKMSDIKTPRNGTYRKQDHGYFVNNIKRMNFNFWDSVFVHQVDYLDQYGNVLYIDIYDIKGFLSQRQYVGFDGNVSHRVYYDIDGNEAIKTAYSSHNDQVEETNIFVKTPQGSSMLFSSLEELRKYYISVLASKDQTNTFLIANDFQNAALFDQLDRKDNQLFISFDNVNNVTINDQIKADGYVVAKNVKPDLPKTAQTFKVPEWFVDTDEILKKDVNCQWRCKNVGLWRLENVGFRRSIGTLQTV